MVFIPSLINPPRVLDLSHSRSMLRHMAAAGHDAYLVDWGTPLAEDQDLSLAGHVSERLLPLLSILPRPPLLVGYCLGGTIALAAAMLRSVAGLATIASPWRFDGFPQEDRDRIAALWRVSKPLCERLGYVPMEVLQSGFWAIDPARTIRRYATFADMEEGSDAALALLALEDWANEGPPLTFAAGCELFEQLYGADITGTGQWRVRGLPVTPDLLTVPSLAIGSTTDRIVPAEASPPLDDLMRLELGHVGMVIGGRARDTLWEPLSRWVSTHGG